MAEMGNAAHSVDVPAHRDARLAGPWADMQDEGLDVTTGCAEKDCDSLDKCVHIAGRQVVQHCVPHQLGQLQVLGLTGGARGQVHTQQGDVGEAHIRPEIGPGW
jgi:hypothetical protein